MASRSLRIWGSGKTRTRTRYCHHGLVRPRSQRQWCLLGIRNRVSGFLKNILPAWLQRYFNKNEDVCSHTTDPKETLCSQENRAADHPMCAGEGSSNINKGRITSEPTVNSTGRKRKLDEDDEGPFRAAKTQKEGRVLNVLKNHGFISPKGDDFAAQPTVTSLEIHTRAAMSSFSLSTTGLRESLKARSSRRFDTRLLPNKVTDDNCIACQATKLPTRDTAEQAGIFKSSKSSKPTISAPGAGFGDQLKVEVPATWVCDTCLVRNKHKARRCIACDTWRWVALPVVSKRGITVTASSSSCPVTTGTVSPFVLGPAAMSNNTSTSGFNCGATTSPSSAGASFIVGTGPSAPSAGPAFGANQTPTFGQSHDANHPHSLGFGSTVSSTALFVTGPQPAPPPTSGMASGGNQPPLFQPQPFQKMVGSGTTNSSGMVQGPFNVQNIHLAVSQKQKARKRKAADIDICPIPCKRRAISSPALFVIGPRPAPPPTSGTASGGNQPPGFHQPSTQRVVGSGTARQTDELFCFAKSSFLGFTQKKTALRSLDKVAAFDHWDI